MEKIKIESYFTAGGVLSLERKTKENILLKLSLAVNEIINWINEHEQAGGEHDPK